MVLCYSCAAQLGGSWVFNYSGLNNGSYLGVDAYFASSGRNLVYCFCQNCFNNGNFAKYLKQWYVNPINQIVQEATNPLKQQKNTLNNTITAQNKRIAELQVEVNKYKADGFILEIKAIVDKVEEQYKYLQTNLTEAKQLFLSLRNEYRLEIKKQVQLIFKRSKWGMLEKLDKIKECFKNDIEAITAIKQKTNQSMRSSNSIHLVDIKLFEAGQIQASNKIFEAQIKQKQRKLQVIQSFLKDNNDKIIPIAKQ